jgi:hypothetical protein
MNMDLEKELRESQMIYPLKANYYLRRVKLVPCPDCPFKEPVSILEQDAFCFSKCPFEIIVWILSPEQLKVYEGVRPTERRLIDLERAMKEGKMVPIK